MLNTLELTHKIIDALAEKKAEDIILLDIHEIAIFTDYFIICSGTSNRMLDGLSNSVIETADRIPGIICRKEGVTTDGWLLIDLGEIIIHIFTPDQRDYYLLEKLWSQGKVLLRIQ
jgi:ribosome-associated protein